MTERRHDINEEEYEQLMRSYKVEETATRLLIAVHRQILLGSIPDRSAIDDAHLALRDALNPDWPLNSDWWPEESDGKA